MFGVVKATQEYKIPIEVVLTSILAITMLYHVLTLSKEESKAFRNAKIIALIGLFILSITVLYNYFINELFDFHVLMLIGAFLPAFFIALYFNVKNIHSKLLKQN